ncbi:MAG TPA: DUF6265 family protein [Longimicrobiales bacterium]|nr:DUF6265 family protein [Longimicrobiales bacterium]
MPGGGQLRRSAALAAALLCLTAAPGTGQQPGAGTQGDPLADLGWLGGCWEGTLANGAVYEEVWLAPRDGTLLGLARMTRDGRTLSFEFMRIVDDAGTPVYIAQPSGREGTHFRARSATANQTATTGEAVFENPGHDFPQRVIYRHTPPDTLLARIEGERDGQLRGIDFPLHRVACPGPPE